MILENPDLVKCKSPRVVGSKILPVSRLFYDDLIGFHAEDSVKI